MSIVKLIKSILLYLFVFIVLLVGLIYWFAVNDRSQKYDVSLDGITIPKFSEQIINFIPTYDKTQTLPFTAGAAVDIDNDGVDELFIGGGIHQQDAFFKFTDGQFKDITAATKWTKSTPDKTFGAISLDLDTDGDNDLLVSRQSGVWLYKNSSGEFAGKKLDLKLNENTVPLSVAVADLNRDGLYDMYVAGYIARKYVEGETIFNKKYGGFSELYINKGDDKFENITEFSGLSYQHNTFQSIFIDVDNDGLEDLIVAHDTGTIKTYKNQGDLKFKDVTNPTSDYFSYPMGIGVTDYGDDGLPDFFFSNVGSTTPDALVKGDLREDQVLHRKWIMFVNQGDFNFKDESQTLKLADYEFSWGAIFEDFNLDGKDDLVVSENYVGFPTHALSMLRLNGRFLLQNDSGEFASAGEQTGVSNNLFGITPVSSDFNQDGYPDLVHVNLLGPQKVFISQAGDANYLKVLLPNTIKSIGAKITVVLEDGAVLNRTFVIGEGLCGDQSHVQIFGLDDQTATNITVTYLDGTSKIESGSFSNQTLQM